MRDKYGEEHDSYCYPSSDVFINLLNIREPDELFEAEAEFTAERYRTYKRAPDRTIDVLKWQM